MNSYEERLARRKERLIKRSEQVRDESNSRLKYSKKLVEHIPFGQPVLVGHHSESRHRNTLKRSRNAFMKGIDLAKKAEALEKKSCQCWNWRYQF